MNIANYYIQFDQSKFGKYGYFLKSNYKSLQLGDEITLAYDLVVRITFIGEKTIDFVPVCPENITLQQASFYDLLKYNACGNYLRKDFYNSNINNIVYSKINIHLYKVISVYDYTMNLEEIQYGC